MSAVQRIELASPSRPRFKVLPPLALYVHIPWCLRKCPYCDFNSHEARGAGDALPEGAYVDALLTDLELALPQIWGRRVMSIFVGGGTPSLFSPASIDRLLAGVRARVMVEPDAEVTLEANPGTFERDRFAGFRAAGVNRLSVGVQSFNPAHLHALGRVHDADEARAAAQAAIASYPEVNLDLMYALPGQSVEQALADVDSAIGLGPSHLSFYHLTIEPNTLFHRYPPVVPDEDAAAEIQSAIEQKLAHADYLHYETSAHARPGHASRHNMNYWQFGDYLGIGAGAHSKLSFADRIVRQVRHKQPRQYLDRVAAGEPLLEETQVTRDAVGFEFMLNALRLIDGVPAALFTERTGYPLALVARPLEEATRRGLIDPDPQWLRPTELGRRFLTDLQALFLPAKPKAGATIHVHAHTD